MKFRNRNQAGFTLLELLVVIAIIGILISLAAPAFYDMIERQRIRAALNEWQSSYYFAQREAMRLKEPVRLCASNDGVVCNANAASKQFNQGWIVIDSANNILQDNAFSEPGISMILSQNNGLAFLSNGRVRGVNNDGSLAGGMFLANIRIGTFPPGGAIDADPGGNNVIEMNISSGGRLTGASR